MTYDIIIIGAGPGGLSAGVYSARYKMKTLLVGELPGGLATEAHKVCNFPSYTDISGFELMNKMIKQNKDLGVEFKQGKVDKIKKKEKEFVVKAGKNEYVGKKIILAMGSKRKKLGLKREEELIGKGVSYCATCDAGFYKGKVAGVIGGGNAALTAALLLAKFAKKVYIFYRRGEFCKAEPSWRDDVAKEKKIEVIYNSVTAEILGEDRLTGVKINKDGEYSEIDLDGLFIEIGSIPQTQLAEDLGVELDCEEIKVDKEMKTSVEGVYACGDVVNNPLKQIITACGDGAVAADTAYREIGKE